MHLLEYLDEIAFRFNNRDNAYLFPRHAAAVLESKALSYEELVAG